MPHIVRTIGITLIYILSDLELILTVKSSKKLQQSDIIAPAVELTSLFGSLLFCIMNIKKGVISSGIQFGFWTLRFFCQTVTFASVVRFGDDLGQVINAVLFNIKYVLGIGVYFLHIWADSCAKDDKFLYGDKPSPVHGSSFPNKIIFAWMTSLLRRGWREPVTQDVLYDLDPSVRCGKVYSTWEKNWNKIANKKQKYSRKPVNILYLLFATFGLSHLFSSLIELLSVLFIQASPHSTY